jgi:hypothetical protein
MEEAMRRSSSGMKDSSDNRRRVMAILRDPWWILRRKGKLTWKRKLKVEVWVKMVRERLKRKLDRTGGKVVESTIQSSVIEI